MATTINITNSGSGAYLIDNVSNGTIQLVRGNTYNLVINANGHPFWIQTVSGGHNSNYIYSSGITNNGTQSGTITFIVPNDAPSILYYACQFHSSMQGLITITGSGTAAQAPTITGFTITDRPYSNGGTFTLTPPTSNSNGAFSYESSNAAIASISGSTVSILQAGSVTITVNQAATTNYTSGSATATFNITSTSNIPTPTITGFTIAPRAYSNGGTFTLTPPTSNSDGAFSYESSNSGIANISESTVTILQAGTVTITATQAATTSYTAGSATATLTINKANPTISNFTILDRPYLNGGTFTLNRPLSFNNITAFVYRSSDTTIASVSGSTVTILQVGNVAITVTQEENNNYLFGSATTTFTISKAIPSLSGFTIRDKPYLIGSTFTLTPPLSDSTGIFSYESSNPAIASIVHGTNTVNILQLGNVTITASQGPTINYESATITASFNIINPSIVCLTNPSNVNIIASNGNNYVFNDLTSYESTRLYGLGIGTYILQNVQESHPMALLNNAVKSSISYSGDSSKKLTKSVNGVSYDFYYGNITVQVNSNFNTISIYCYYHGYMGGENLFKYSDSCYIKPVPIITNFNIPNETYLSAGIIQLTPPLSNSDGAFSYYSSNPKIAIIDGSILTILQVGTITITAIQAETNTYKTGNISKTLTINRISSGSFTYLNDCTQLYSTIGAPARITTLFPLSLNGGIRLIWNPPENVSNVLIETYVIRYKLTGAPLSQTLGEVFSTLTNAVVSGLSNGISYDFWIVGKNRFGEGPYSPVVSIIPGFAPSPSQFIRRTNHSTTVGNGIGLDPSLSQKIGIEFTPPVSNNGARPLVLTIKYTRVSDIVGYSGGGVINDISFVMIENVENNQIMLDASNALAIRTTAIKGNYIRREIIPPYNSIVTGNYRFEVFTNNSYGLSTGPDISFVIPIYSPNDANIIGSQIPRIISPTFSSYSDPSRAGIVSVVASDGSFRFRWKQYRGIGFGSSGADAYTGWVYRIQYTDDKDYWYSPPTSISLPLTARYLEYTVPYDRTSIGSNSENFEYFIDISRNVINGRQYYFRYSVVNALGDTSEYTQITDTNLAFVSAMPGKIPQPPQIFNAAVDDRLVRLFFGWVTNPPSSELTGGPPVIDYRIERYIVNRSGSNISVTPTPNAVLNNIVGPYYEDTLDIRVNGTEYLYKIYTRTAYGYSTQSKTVTAIPSRKSDVVYNVNSSVDTSQITLYWYPPLVIEPGVPIVQYYIEYRLFDFTLISQIPSANILGTFLNQSALTNSIQDMNSILVNDILWSVMKSTVKSAYTNSTNLYYTLRNLENKKPYLFRIAAVTQDRARRNLIGLMTVIGNNSPYLSRPTIIGKVPDRLVNVEYTVGSASIIIKWSSANVTNTESIIRFVVDYRVFGSGSAYLTQTFEYINSLIFNNGVDNALFLINVSNIETNIESRPLTSTNSYEMIVYAENAVGYTNVSDRINLHTDLQFTDVYENLVIPRLVRPAMVPSIIIEARE
jgi:hypothetical protein